MEVSKEVKFFLKKYYPHGWRFYQKPGGLELYFLKPELTFTFFLFIFFIAGCFLLTLLWDASFGIGNQTPPSTAENNDCSVSGNYCFSRSEVAVLRQSNSHARPRIQRSDSEVECRDSSV